MKRIFALILALVICFSLVACGAGGSKYVGIYEDEDIGMSLAIMSDNTFRYKNEYYGDDYEGIWKVVDGYLVLYSSDNEYLELYGDDVNYPVQCELKGIQLVTGTNGDRFIANKIS